MTDATLIRLARKQTRIRRLRRLLALADEFRDAVHELVREIASDDRILEELIATDPDVAAAPEAISDAAPTPKGVVRFDRDRQPPKNEPPKNQPPRKPQ